jgi:hypothetical protein
MISPLPRTAQAQGAFAVFESNGVVVSLIAAIERAPSCRLSGHAHAIIIELK